MTLSRSLASETLRAQPDGGGSTNQLPLGNKTWIGKGGGIILPSPVSTGWTAGAGGEVFLHRLSLLFLMFGLLLVVVHPIFASDVGLCRNYGSEMGFCFMMVNGEIGNSHRVRIGFDCSPIVTSLAILWCLCISSMSMINPLSG